MVQPNFSKIFSLLYKLADIVMSVQARLDRWGPKKLRTANNFYRLPFSQS